ncbi:NYN domain-containing protein [Myxococcota bacterium]|nr:NYN domain-containing protein [Myxococcota bacterium]MBU1412978.1 NYN domain-containing protein [Myxococcota bacterium]MBU1510460.1 NYN domain-containing protein [Myxococcota bacterium]
MHKNEPSKYPSRIELPEEHQPKLAVLIDADNAQAAIIDGLLAEIARFGVASVRRIYGDWTSTRLQSWKKTLLQYSIQPVQQFGYTQGKNATDSALIIDAMDLLYTRRFDGFCLVSSDSDFTRLAMRLREEGLVVYGFGEKKTPEPFVQACDKFIYTEVLRPEEDLPGKPAAASKPVEKGVPKPIVRMIAKSIEDVSEESGWAQLGSVGSNLTKVRPDFDSRLYGFKKFSDLIRAVPDAFELEERLLPGQGQKSIYVRCRVHEKRRK